MNRKDFEDFSIIVSLKNIKDKNYSFSAGQYFPVKIKYVELTQDEFTKKIEEYNEKLNILFKESKKIEENIKRDIKDLSYE